MITTRPGCAVYFMTSVFDDVNQIPLCRRGTREEGGRRAVVEQIEGMLMIDLQQLVHMIGKTDQ